MQTSIKLVISGEPKGKQRPRTTLRKGFVKTYTPEDTLNYESRVIMEYRQHYGGLFFEPHQEIWATITAYYAIPKQHYKFYKKEQETRLTKQGQEMLNGEINPTKKPDCDNIAKICLDALNGVAYPDDSQVTGLLVIKKYAEEPRVEIILEGR